MARPGEDEDEGLSARWALIVAALVVLFVRELVPFGGLVLYPFTLFCTWVHEMGHGLAGLAVGGTFEHLEIFANASGLAYGAVERGWPEAARAAGGLLAPPLSGAAILALARGPKRARIVLAVIAALLVISAPIWVRSLTGWIVVPALGLAIGAAAWRAGATTAHIGAQFLGVLLALDTVTRIDYLFTGSVFVGGRDRPSDVAIIADAVGGHYLLWGALLALISLALLVLGVRLAWAEPVRVTLPWKRKGASR